MIVDARTVVWWPYLKHGWTAWAESLCRDHFKSEIPRAGLVDLILDFVGCLVLPFVFLEVNGLPRLSSLDFEHVIQDSYRMLLEVAEGGGKTVMYRELGVSPGIVLHVFSMIGFVELKLRQLI